MVAVGVVCTSSSIGSSSRSSADNGLRDYGFVGIADCARIGCGYGLRDYGLFCFFFFESVPLSVPLKPNKNTAFTF